MIAAATERKRIRLEQGFEVYVLRNEALEVAVVPELGARIISLKNLRTGREWMWHPAGGPKLFQNRPGDDFSQSPLVGADECLPTIAPCSSKGRKLPDHGEVWTAAWQVDRAAWKHGLLKTSVEMAVSPLKFERTVEVREQRVQLSYRLSNQSPVKETFLWALHPLLRVRAGDRLKMPATTRALLDGNAWVDAVDAVVPEGGCSKVFAERVEEGLVGIANAESGDTLVVEWNPAENDTLGLWLTRGGWHGHHHLALEPTNGAPDSLDVAAARRRCGIVPSFGSKSWSISLRVEP